MKGVLLPLVRELKNGETQEIFYLLVNLKLYLLLLFVYTCIK